MSPDDTPSVKVKALSHPVCFFMLDINALNHLYLSFLLVLLTSKQLSSAIWMSVMSENVGIACNILEPNFAQRFWSGILRISRNGNLLQ